jgi:type VI secretion system secreted protein VgrG
MADTRKITVKTPLEDKLLLRSAVVTEHLGQPFEIDVDLLSSDENIDLDDLLGKELTLSVALDDGSSRYFHAFIASFEQHGRFGRYASYRAQCVPWLWFLGQKADCRIFQDKAVPDIVKQVFRDNGCTDFQDSLTKNYRVREYCVQYRETDLNFVQRLMQDEGIYYYFKHTDSSHVLVLADSLSAHEPFKNYERIEYFPPTENEVRPTDHIHDWFLSRNLQSGRYTLRDFNFTKPRLQLESKLSRQRSHPHSSLEVYDYPGHHTSPSEGDHYVRTRLEELQTRFERVTGIGNARGIGAGGLFTLASYPRTDQNKEYLVVATNQHLQATGYETDNREATEEYSCSFEAADSKEPFRSARTAIKTRVAGPQTAIVVGPSGEEIWTDNYARVKVQFHWDRLGKTDENSSCWVRVSQIWAGKNWGWITIPRIGQEVVVDFLEGDPDQPLITGRVYNQDNLPPYDLPSDKTQSGIKTRSSKDGTPANFNEIRFEDKKGSEQLYIHAEKNKDQVVENDETQKIGHDRTENVGNDEKITIGHDRNESVGNNETIAVAVNRTETVGSNETITIGSNRSISVGASETATVTLQRTHSVGVNETISVGAAQEISVGAAQAISVGAAQTTQVGADRSISVGGKQSVDISGDQSMSIGKNESHSVGEGRSTSVSKDDALSVGNNLTISAGDSITITTGDASISMKKDGTIVIRGKDITVQGSGKINVKADGDLVTKGSKIQHN